MLALGGKNMNATNEEDRPKENSQEKWAQDFLAKIARKLSSDKLEKWNKLEETMESEYFAIIEQNSHLVMEN